MASSISGDEEKAKSGLDQRLLLAIFSFGGEMKHRKTFRI
jgi:hypothetical protein